MEFYKKYKHIGYSFIGVPKGWISIVELAVICIEREMWPRWLPFPVKRLVHWLATGNSVVCVKYWWAYRLRKKLTKGQIIFDIKEKYATLRIYGAFGDKIEKLIEHAELECNRTCQHCGSNEGVFRSINLSPFIFFFNSLGTALDPISLFDFRNLTSSPEINSPAVF
jgi:hypothetical protein